MKKSALLVFGVVTILGLTAGAVQSLQAHFSKTVSFPLTSLQKVEQSLQDSAARQGDAMKTIASYTIDSNLTLVCAEDSPVAMDGHLWGCALQMPIDLGHGATVTMQNMVYLQQSSTEISDIFAKTDVNKVDTVQLKSPFDGGRGSSYYCNAEGTAGARQWACYLKFVD